MEGSDSTRRSDSLNYIQSLLGQLRDLAAAERLGMLTYLIEMAYVEATDVIRTERSPPSSGDGGTQ